MAAYLLNQVSFASESFQFVIKKPIKTVVN